MSYIMWLCYVQGFSIEKHGSSLHNYDIEIRECKSAPETIRVIIYQYLEIMSETETNLNPLNLPTTNKIVLIISK